MKGILLTPVSAEYEALAELTDPGKIEWCNRWGWEYVKAKGFYGWWDRPQLWRDTLGGCDWMFFMGCDALVTNPTIPPILSHELTIAVEAAGINDDVFFIQRNPATLAFLDDLCNWPDKSVISEQDAMELLLCGLPSISKLEHTLRVKFVDGGNPASRYLRRALRGLLQHRLRVNVVNQRTMNGYPQRFYGRRDDEPYGWQPLDFCAHLPGMSLEQRIIGVREILERNH